MTHFDGNEVRQTGLVEQLARTVASLTDLRLIAIDPAARFRGGVENLAEDTTRFVEAIETLAKLTGAALLVVHHTNKKSMDGGDQDQSASRGSSALTDGVRLQINLAYPNKDEKRLLGEQMPGGFLVATITKANYSTRGDPIYLRRDDQGRLFPVNLGDQKKSLEDALVDQIVATVRDEQTAKRRYSTSSFAYAHGGRDRTFKMGQTGLKRLIDVAVSDGRLQIESGKAKFLRAPEIIPKAKVILPTAIADD